MSGSFPEFLTSGDVPLLYYPWGLCILLQKTKCRDLEYRFLTGWVKHFSGRGFGRRYEMLAVRLVEMKLAQTSPPKSIEAHLRPE